MNESVEEPVPLIESMIVDGDNVSVGPAGELAAVNVTVPAKLLNPAIAMVEFDLTLIGSVTRAGDAVMV